MRKVVFLFLVLLLPFLFITPTYAAKPRTGSGATAISSKPGASVSFRKDRKAIYLNLWGLNAVSTVTYQLMYNASGIPQGAIGTITPKSSSASRELLFGTCSKNVCRYHTNITSAKITVSLKTKTGQTIKKAFRLKP